MIYQILKSQVVVLKYPYKKTLCPSFFLYEALCNNYNNI
jgi:hypothetical protein